MKNNSVSTPKYSFAVIKHRGSPNEAETMDGLKVYREEKLFFSTFGKFVKVAPYDNHFLYIDPSDKIGRYSPMCTCGSAGGIVGFDAYKKDASRQGELVVCLHHAQHNKHADGSS